MAPKDRCDPEEGIIELFDIVDIHEAASGTTSEAPDDLSLIHISEPTRH